MTRSEKHALVESLVSEFENAAAVVLCNYQTMTVSELEDVRVALKKADIKAKVVKNTLGSIAMEKSGKPGMVFADMNLAVWGEDLVSVAKTIIKLDKEMEKLEIKTAHIEGEVVDKTKVEAYSKLPGKEELLGMLLSTWTAPARNFVYVLSGVQREFVTVLDAIKQQKESA